METRTRNTPINQNHRGRTEVLCRRNGTEIQCWSESKRQQMRTAARNRGPIYPKVQSTRKALNRLQTRLTSTRT